MTANTPDRGIFAALWLPTDADGNLLKRELAGNIAWLKEQGVHGLLALGSTGEFPYFSCEQRKAALTFIAETAAPLPVIANISDVNPRVIAALGSHARQLRLPAVAIMTPWFYPCSQADILAHLLHAADAAKIPAFLYNFPDLTHMRIDKETVAAFADRAPLAGIKQSGSEFEYHKELIQLGREKNFVVLSGADVRLPEVFALGATGCIGGLANIAPELMLHIYRICREGAAGSVEEAAQRLRIIIDHIVKLPFPWSIAAAMEARGLAVGTPKAIQSQKSERMSAEAVVRLKQCFAEWSMSPPNAQ